VKITYLNKNVIKKIKRDGFGLKLILNHPTLMNKEEEEARGIRFCS
jgi:hypothetical protein